MSKISVKALGYTGAIAALAGVALIMFSGEVAAGASTLGGMASNVTKSFTSVTKLITAMSYVAGLGFAVGSIIKFKAHKDNAQQTPIGQPIGLLLVAVALLFLPTLLSVAGTTMFGGGQSTGGPTGTVFTS